MGASLSSSSEGGPAEAGPGPNLGDIPESCIAEVLCYMDPPEICQLAQLNRAFRGASSADFIWESKLPPNYPFIVRKILNLNHIDHHGNKLFKHHHDHDGDGDNRKRLITMEGFANKKDIFARLSRPNPFDAGTKEIWLDKNSGGVCLSISSKALSITGMDDRRYWNLIPTDESRFQTVAYLLQIWWFEVCGQLDFKFPIGTYSLFFRIQLGRSTKRFGRRTCNLEHIHGWDIRPVQFQLSTSDGQHATSQHYLDNPGSWNLYHVGDFVIKDPHNLTTVKFSAMQIDCTHIKGGLSLDSVLIYPKHYTVERV